MDRRRYLVAYDIRHPRRLHAVHKTMKEFGEPLQYSVFLCDLDGAEKPGLLLRLAVIIKHNEDSVVIVDLGVASDRGQLCFEFLGVHRMLPPSGAVIV